MKYMDYETREKLLKTAKGALIAGGGVALTYFLQALSSMDFGNASAIVAGVCAVLINALRLYTQEKP